MPQAQTQCMTDIVIQINKARFASSMAVSKVVTFDMDAIRKGESEVNGRLGPDSLASRPPANHLYVQTLDCRL